MPAVPPPTPTPEAATEQAASVRAEHAPVDRRALRAGSRRAARHDRRLVSAISPGAFWAITALRRRPVVRLPLLGVVVNDARLIREAFLRSSDFTKSGSKSVAWALTQVFGDYAMLNMEGEEHRRLRLALRDVFTPAVSSAVARSVAAPLVADLLTRLEAGETCDVAETARLASGCLMAELTGFEGTREETFAEARRLNGHSSEMTRCMSITSMHPRPHKLVRAREIFHEMVRHVESASQREGSACIPGTLARAGYDLDQIRGIVGVLMLGGVETTASAFSRLVALLVDSGQLTLLRRRPELLASAVNECLRFAAPIPVSTRTIDVACELGGRRLEPDTKMLLIVRNGLRDRTVIDDPDIFDITRDVPRELRMLWFGAGPHFCVGYAIAVEIVSLLGQALIDASTELEVVRRAPVRDLVPAYRRLEVRLARS